MVMLSCAALGRGCHSERCGSCYVAKVLRRVASAARNLEGERTDQRQPVAPSEPDAVEDREVLPTPDKAAVVRSACYEILHSASLRSE